MRDFLVSLGGFVAVISLIFFTIGFFMLFFDSKRKTGLKCMLFSVIGFIIGFSTCAASFNLNLH